MSRSRPPRDNKLLDALEKKPRKPFAGMSWRAVRDGRDPTVGSSAGGRWDDGTFDVLYTALEADGATAEIHFHLSKGQPVFPSMVAYRLFKLGVQLTSCLEFIVVDDLASLGVNTSKFGRLSYAERAGEYATTQAIGEAVHFLGCDGLIVPNARWKCQNLIVFSDRVSPASLVPIEEGDLIDWVAWRKRTGQS
jgi:RES domain